MDNNNIELLKNINDSFVKNQKENLDIFSNLELSEDRPKINNNIDEEQNSENQYEQQLKLKLKEQLKQLQKEHKAKKITKYQSFPPVKEVPEDYDLRNELNELKQINNVSEDIKNKNLNNYIEYKNFLISIFLFYILTTEPIYNLFNQNIPLISNCNYNIKLLVKLIVFSLLYFTFSYLSKKYLYI
jgi:hypothetical protein